MHHVTIDLLRDAFLALKRRAAPGVDGVTWQDYETALEGNLQTLHDRVHRGAYRALPVRRRFIPKPGGQQRPLGVTALEDKILQRAVVTVLNAIYEEDFLGFSYGFRPGRSQHDALDALMVGVSTARVNWILDADIRSFFDKIDQSWLVRFLEHRVGDERIIRLVRKWLKAGVLDEGIWSVSETGTPQGAVASPLLANVYLHYVFDLWAAQWRRQQAKGRMIIVRYADDLIADFEHEADARRFWDSMRERFEKFGLELHGDKTRLLEFGRYATERRQRKGLGRPETFKFLGFVFICGKSRRGKLSDSPQDQRRPHASATPGDQALLEAAHACPDPASGTMAQCSAHRLLCIPRGSDELSDSCFIPAPGCGCLAAFASAAQPEGRYELGEDDADRRRVAASTPNPSSVARPALCRQTPKVGAECLNRARSDLCGGCLATGIPTAISSSADRSITSPGCRAMPRRSVAFVAQSARRGWNF
jgi:group II intron reverse transcriptase/maturase